MSSISSYSPPPVFRQIPFHSEALTPTPSSVRRTRSTAEEEPVIATPTWTLEAPGENVSTRQGDTVLAGRLSSAVSSGEVRVNVPHGSSLEKALQLYRDLLNQPQALEWFARKGLELDSLTLHKHEVKGYTTRDGVRTAVAFSATDDSGWWQVSAKMRAIRDLLDPEDKGMPCLDSGEYQVPLHVATSAYDLPVGEAPTSPLVLSPTVVVGMKDVRRVIADLDERAFLASLMEAHLLDMPADRPIDWTLQQINVSPASAEGIGHQARYNVDQLLRYKGLGSPQTAEASRHVIEWLRVALPPAPPEGDYSGLDASQPARAQWRALESPPGTVGGFELYHPVNMGRTFSEVRNDLVQHLRDKKGLEPSLAGQVATIGLAQVAPEFLVREGADATTIGTPAWTELRLGCEMAEAVAPGTSRALNSDQVRALTTLVPTSDEQRTLMQVRASRVLLDWAVLNGIVPAKPQGQHTASDLKKASEVFNRQRRLATRAFNITGTPLPTRRLLAQQELLKVFPDKSARQLEAMTVQLVDAKERRNLRASEPRTRSLIDTYMTGDLVPGKWILSSDVPPTGPGQAPRTPFQFQNDETLPMLARNKLDGLIRRLPVLDDLLKTAVSKHHNAQQRAFVTKLKLMFAKLPLADRQRIELGAVDLFTLRKKTGKQQVWESDDDRAAVRGRQGTLMRVLHDQAVTYYEVLNSGRIIRHDDLATTSALDKVMRDTSYLGQYKLQGQSYIRGGHDVPLDFEAYASGSQPRPGVTSSDVIIDRLGRNAEAGSLPANQTLATFVPDSYQSDRVEFIACEIAEQNFYESAEQMLKRAKGQLPVEKSRAEHARDINLLTSLVPFVGAYQDFADGNITKGLQSLALDVGGVLVGAGGQARKLLGSGKAFTLGSLAPTRGKLSASVKPWAPKVAWSWNEPKLRFSDAALDFSKQTTQFFNAVFNPLDGYPRLLGATSRGLTKLPRLATTNHLGLSKALPHLAMAEEKLKCYFLVGTGLVDPGKPPAIKSE